MAGVPRPNLACSPASGRAVAAVVAFVLVSLAPAVAAQEGRVAMADVTVANLQVTNGAIESGGVDLVYVHRLALGGEDKMPRLTIGGGQIVATLYNQTGYEFSDGQQGFTTLGAACQEPLRSNGLGVGCAVADSHSGAAATVNLVGVEEEYTVNLFGTGMAHEATYGAAALAPVNNPTISPAGVGQDAAPTSPNGPNSSSWTFAGAQGPHVMTTPTTVSHLSITGDFTFEVIGADFVMKSADGSYVLHSGVDRQGLTGPIPADQAQAVARHFLRIQVTAGSLQLDINNPLTTVGWTSPGSMVAASGITLKQATGSETLADGTKVTVNSQTIHDDGLNQLRVTPSPAAMGVHMEAVGTDAHAVDPRDSSIPGATVLLGFVAVAVLGLTGAVVALVRRSRTPVLADVEAAIEAGHYRRAAADAARILRRRPNMEDAILSRAIALCKAGKPARVVQELRTALAERKPSDGSLHYVLGLAYLDLGKRTDAEAVFGEALRRTPALLKDVQGKLGVAGTPSRTPEAIHGSESTHGYA